MTEQTPPPPPPPEEPTAVETDPAPETPRRSRKGLVIGAIAVVAVLALAGGAFAVFTKLGGGGAQPHDVLPSTVSAYARVDVDPSAGQKIALFKLIRKFPAAADDLGIKSADEDVRKLLVEEALSGSDCDLSYDKDIEPWLGERLGFGLDEELTPLVAVQVTDEDKAEKGIKALFACEDEEAAMAFLDGYAIVAEDQETADAAVKAATDKSLAERQEFADDFDALGEQGVASAWMDNKALLEDIPEMAEDFGGLSSSEFEEFAEAGTSAMALRTDGSTLELAGLVGLTESVKDMSNASISTLPADTVMALSIGGLGDRIGEQVDGAIQDFTLGLTGLIPPTPPLSTEDMSDGGDTYEDLVEDSMFGSPDPQDYIEDFEDWTGLRIPEDIETLLAKGLTLSVGSANLERIPTLSGPDDVASLDVAMEIKSDPASKALDLTERLAALAGQIGVTLSTAQTDDGAVIATNEDAAGSLDGAGTLGDDDTFASVMPFGDDTTYGLFVDVATILDKLLQADPPEDIERDIKEVEPLRAVGISAGKDDDHALFSLRIAFTK